MTRDQLLYKICPTDMTFDCWSGNKSCNCHDCDRVLDEWLDEYDKYIIEQYKENIKLKDTIKNIHDSVSIQMYCKGIDDLCKAISNTITYDEYDNVVDVFEIAWKLKKNSKQLKAGEKI